MENDRLKNKSSLKLRKPRVSCDFCICISCIFTFYFLLSTSIAHAATLYFDPQERTVGLNQPFEVGLLIDATNPINAFDVTIDIPANMSVTDSSDGNSIISYWIERPTYDPSKN